MIRRPPRSTLRQSSAASDVYKRQTLYLTLHRRQQMILLMVLAASGVGHFNVSIMGWGGVGRGVVSWCFEPSQSRAITSGLGRPMSHEFVSSTTKARAVSTRITNGKRHVHPAFLFLAGLDVTTRNSAVCCQSSKPLNHTSAVSYTHLTLPTTASV